MDRETEDGPPTSFLGQQIRCSRRLLTPPAGRCHLNSIQDSAYVRGCIFCFSVEEVIGAAVMRANVKKAVPFFGVAHMAISAVQVKDLDSRASANGYRRAKVYPSDGEIRWFWLELGEGAIMLQEFVAQGRPAGSLGTGASVSF